MAQENRQQPQGTSAPTKAQPQVPPDSPFYTKDNMPENCTPAARWLLKRDWKCLGDPNWESSLWYDPAAPEEETAHKEPKLGYVWRDKRNKDGKLVAEPELMQLYQQDGGPQGNRTLKIEQLVCTMPARPVRFQEAVAIQRARDEKARRESGQKPVAIA